MAISKITTIKLEKETKSRLDGLKEHKRETYDDVIKKTLNIINICIRNPSAGARIFRNIKRKKIGKGVPVYQEYAPKKRSIDILQSDTS